MGKWWIKHSGMIYVVAAIVAVAVSVLGLILGSVPMIIVAGMIFMVGILSSVTWLMGG